MKDSASQKIVALADLVHLKQRPLPVAPDGRYDSQVQPATAPADNSDKVSALHKVLDVVQNRKSHGPLIQDPTKTADALLNVLAHPTAIDDRRGLFNEIFAIIGKLPQGTALSKKLNDSLITVLYNTLSHPPESFIGTDVPKSINAAPVTASVTNNGTGTFSRMPFAFRSADGSGNNPLCPQLGQAGTSYARSVQSRHPVAPNTLPDLGEVFDALLKANDFVPHPGGNSSLTFAYASLVTHQLFRTDPLDFTKNNTSSYLDLSVVYGINQSQQDLVRDKKQGRGLLYPDAFAEDRLSFLPPASGALLVIFSRNHNYIADMLLKINERGRWTDPSKLDENQRALQDEEIFQVARLVNCGHFMATIFGDYVAGFLGLGRDGVTWSMNPFDAIKSETGVPLGRGEGNHCSVEFNLLYRWHATTAQEDIKWTEDIFSEAFQVQNNDFSTLGLKDFLPAVKRSFAHVDPNPRTRTFANLKRGPDGTFSDDDLAEILQHATEKPAGAYRARGTPEVLRIIEMLGMQQARSWGVCTFNEFRTFLGLKPMESFEEWNPDPDVADAARKLYGHIDNLELYPGLQAEAIIPLGPGSGICCGYTLTRAILADAIALVRGDRFYTTEYTPSNLTAWGFQDCARDPNNGAFGAALPKLLFRHLPRHYPDNSVYGLFPFFTPETTTGNLAKLEAKGIISKASDYDFKRPVPHPIPKVINTLKGIRHVFNDPTKFKTTYKDLPMLTRGYGFILVFDDKEKHNTDLRMVIHALYPDKATVTSYAEWYKQKTTDLIDQYSYTIHGLPGKRVDIVRNVINVAAVHWAANYMCGISIKDKANPRGAFTEQELYDIFSLLFTCVFINVVPEHGWALRMGGKKVGDLVNSMIENSIKEAAPRTDPNTIKKVFTQVFKLFLPTEQKLCYPFLSRLAESGRPMDQLVAQVIGLAVGSCANYAQAVAHIVDFYLDDARAKERAEIIKLSHRDDPESLRLLMGYVREAQRLNPQFSGLLRFVAEDDNIPIDDTNSVAVQRGDLVFASFKNAQLNPVDFPNPTEVNPNRPATSYQNQGAGFHNCIGMQLCEQTIPEILKIIFRLKNIRRAPGNAGTMASVINTACETDTKLYLTNTGTISPWPGSLTIVVRPIPSLFYNMQFD